MSPRVLKPGIGATLYSLDRVERAREVIEASDFVTVHTSADAGDVRTAEAIRRIKPTARVWLALPANPLVRMKPANAVATVKAAAEIALAMGAECLELNGEGASDPDVKGDWNPATPAEREALAHLGAELFDAIGDAAPTLARWLTSHDMPRGFPLPWGALLRHVEGHSPQHYPAQEGREVKTPELAARVERSRGQWQTLAARSEVPADMVPRGASWAPYGQGWGHTVGAICWLLDQALLGRVWAFPNSWRTNATTALRAMRKIRDEVGHAPGAVARWQAAHGLKADGDVGPKTLAALGLA